MRVILIDIRIPALSDLYDPGYGCDNGTAGSKDIRGILAPAGEISHTSIRRGSVDYNRIFTMCLASQIDGLVEVKIPVARCDHDVDAFPAKLFDRGAEGELRLNRSPGAVDRLEIDFLCDICEELESFQYGMHFHDGPGAAENVHREDLNTMCDAGYAVAIPVRSDDPCHMGPMRRYRFLLCLRPFVAAGIKAVLPASVFCLLLLAEFVEHALQVRMIRVDACIHDADRAGSIGRRILISAPLGPSGHAKPISSCRGERRCVDVRGVRQIPLHFTEVAWVGGVLLCHC